MLLKSLAAVSVGLVGGVDAFWRMECPGRVGLGRLDPIMSPGEVSQHVHAIAGSSAFSETSATPDLLAGNCTSCRVTQDKSAYWHPALYFQDAATGQFEIVEQVGGMLAYYLLYGDNIQAYPTNFRMISGDSRRRTYTAGDPSQPDPPQALWASLNQTGQDILQQRAVGFNCLNYAIQPEGTLYRHYLPDKAYIDANCKDGVRFEKMFPSCWKGGDAVDSEDHMSHVAFPDLVMTGDCPEGYPVRLPSMLFEVIWNTPEFVGRDGQFVIANGDTTGFGYHGDFIMGWDEGFLQQAVDTCTNPSGMIEDCPLFDVVDEITPTECSITLSQGLVNENVTGPVDMLPGNVEITYANSSSDGSSGAAPTSGAPAPTLTYAPGDRPSNSASPLPGQIFKESSSPYAAPAATADSSAAAASGSVGALDIPEVASTSPSPPAMTASPTSSMSYYSTQYITNGNVVSEILWEEEFVTVTEEVDTTVTVTALPPAASAKRRRREAHVHVHGHHHL